MEYLNAENRRLADRNQLLSSKLEKLRKVTVKVPELQHEIETLRESKTVFDKSKLQLIKDKSDLEEERFLVAQKYEKLQQRFQAIDKELD